MNGLSIFLWTAATAICLTLLALVESLYGVKMVAVAALFLAIVYGLHARFQTTALLEVFAQKEATLEVDIDESRHQIRDLTERIKLLEAHSINKVEQDASAVQTSKISALH